MSYLQQKPGARKTLWFVLIVGCILQILVRPGAAMQSAAHGMQLCCEAVIPSLFPFLVLCELLLQSPLAGFFGLPFIPFARAMGIRSARAAAALFCGLLGGFAAAARSVDKMYREGEISSREASVLLVCCTGSSPAFVVGSVGYAMLGSAQTGWLMFASQTAANLVCGFACSRLFRFKSAACPPHPSLAAQNGVGTAVRGAVSSMAVLCGYIILFSFLAGVWTPSSAGAFARFAICLPMEVTAACQSASLCAAAYRAPLCMAALSLMGTCVFLQVRALVHPQVCLVPLALARAAHLPLSLAFLAVLMHLFPAHLPAASFGGRLLASRMPADAVCLVFCMCALAVCPRRRTSA